MYGQKAWMLFLSLLSLASFAATNPNPSPASNSGIVQSAQRQIRQHSIGIGLGQTFLLGGFENKGDNRITVDMLYAYTASYSFDLLVGYHQSSHSFSNKSVTLEGLNLGVKGRAYDFDNFSPFLLGGFGFYQPRIEVDGVKSRTKSAFGFHLGAGVDLMLNERVVVGALARFDKPFDIKQENSEDVSGSYFKLLLTVMYLF